METKTNTNQSLEKEISQTKTQEAEMPKIKVEAEMPKIKVEAEIPKIKVEAAMPKIKKEAEMPLSSQRENSRRSEEELKEKSCNPKPSRPVLLADNSTIIPKKNLSGAGRRRVARYLNEGFSYEEAHELAIIPANISDKGKHRTLNTTPTPIRLPPQKKDPPEISHSETQEVDLSHRPGSFENTLDKGIQRKNMKNPPTPIKLPSQWKKPFNNPQESARHPTAHASTSKEYHNKFSPNSRPRPNVKAIGKQRAQLAHHLKNLGYGKLKYMPRRKKMVITHEEARL